MFPYYINILDLFGCPKHLGHVKVK